MSSSGKRRDMDVTKLVELIDDKEFNVDFHGPKDSLYQGGVWKMFVEIPDDYPYKPPTIFFTNKIYHHNIYKQSSECFQSVPATTAVLYPNPSDPFNQEAAALMMGDLPVYEQTVKEYCEKYAKPEDVAVSSEEKSTDEEPSEAESHSGDETVLGNPDL